MPDSGTDTIKRLVAYEKSGATFVRPGVARSCSVRAVDSAVSKPVNFMVGLRASRSPWPNWSKGTSNDRFFFLFFFFCILNFIVPPMTAGEAASEAKQRGACGYLDETGQLPT